MKKRRKVDVRGKPKAHRPDGINRGRRRAPLPDFRPFIEVQGPLYWHGQVNGAPGPVTITRAVLRATVDGEARVFVEDLIIPGILRPERYEAAREEVRGKMAEYMDGQLKRRLLLKPMPGGKREPVPFKSVEWVEA